MTQRDENSLSLTPRGPDGKSRKEVILRITSASRAALISVYSGGR